MYEELQENPVEFLKKILKLCELDWISEFGKLDSKKVNASLDPRLYGILRFLNRITATNYNTFYPKWWLNRDIVMALCNRIIKLLDIKEKAKFSGHELEIIEYFAESNRYLIKEFNLNLKKYDYPT